MKKLSAIQKRNNLNEVYTVDEQGAGGACHQYIVLVPGEISLQDDSAIVATIQFQHGARNESTSTLGVLDGDLLEIVRDRLKAFQAGSYATRENALALTHIEEALLWMAKRADDRVERGVLGTMQK